MLGDDIMNGTKKGIAVTSHASGNMVRGAILFGAVAAAVVTVGLLASGFAAGGGIATLGALFGDAMGLGSATAGATAAAQATLVGAVKFIAGWAGTAALAGGAITGITSFLPGKGSWHRGFNKLENMGKNRQHEQAREQVTERGAPASTVVYSSAPAAGTPASYNNAPVYYTTPQQPAVQAEPHHTTIVNNMPQMPAPQQPRESYAASTREVSTVREVAPAQPSILQTEPAAPALTADLAPENPYYRTGRGMEALQRGNERSLEQGGITK